MADESSAAILASVQGLHEKFDELRGDVAALKKTDEDLATEVHRIGQEQVRMKQDLLDLKAETTRTFESERHAARSTMEAIVKHVDESAAAFREKAEHIDALKTETEAQSTELAKQSAELAKQTAILTRLDTIAANPMVRKVAYVVGTAILAWLASKGLK